MDKDQVIEWIKQAIANHEEILEQPGNLNHDHELKCWVSGSLVAWYQVAFNLTGDPIYKRKYNKIVGWE
jgi:hypothetical protein